MKAILVKFSRETKSVGYLYTYNRFIVRNGSCDCGGWQVQNLELTGRLEM